ncbi:hypothetical protein EMIT0196MI5_70181 [Pseudomonas sp. IT-196MI5]
MTQWKRGSSRASFFCLAGLYLFFCCISYLKGSRGLLGPFSNLMERGAGNILRYTRCIFREQQGCSLCKIA